MKPGARLRVASDIPAYVRWTLEQVAAHDRAKGRTFRFAARAAGDWRTRAPDWPPTRYEAKAIAAGRVPAYLEFERV